MIKTNTINVVLVLKDENDKQIRLNNKSFETKYEIIEDVNCKLKNEISKLLAYYRLRSEISDLIYDFIYESENQENI